MKDTIFGAVLLALCCINIVGAMAMYAAYWYDVQHKEVGE